jgi:hypothetical protein
MIHVPYRGPGPAIADLVAGQVQVLFVGTPESIELIRSGKVRALAVTTAARSDALPEIPTVGEFVTGYQAGPWSGVGAPKSTSPEIIDKLNKDQCGPGRSQDEGAVCRGRRHGACSRLARRLRKVHCRRNREVGKVIRAANIKPE